MRINKPVTQRSVSVGFYAEILSNDNLNCLPAPIEDESVIFLRSGTRPCSSHYALSEEVPTLREVAGVARSSVSRRCLFHRFHILGLPFDAYLLRTRLGKDHRRRLPPRGLTASSPGACIANPIRTHLFPWL